MASPTTNPENMLPIMIVLGIMFIGICIAMNLFSRARFKKRTNAFAAARTNTPNRRSHRSSSSGPGGGQRYDGHAISRSVSPYSTGGAGGGGSSQEQQSGATTKTISSTMIAKQHQVPYQDKNSLSRVGTPSSNNNNNNIINQQKGDHFRSSSVGKNCK